MAQAKTNNIQPELARQSPDRAYRATPGCAIGCALCEIRCAVATRIRDDIREELARAESAVMAFRPVAIPSAKLLH